MNRSKRSSSLGKTAMCVVRQAHHEGGGLIAEELDAGMAQTLVINLAAPNLPHGGLLHPEPVERRTRHLANEAPMTDTVRKLLPQTLKRHKAVTLQIPRIWLTLC